MNERLPWLRAFLPCNEDSKRKVIRLGWSRPKTDAFGLLVQSCHSGLGGCSARRRNRYGLLMTGIPRCSKRGAISCSHSSILPDRTSSTAWCSRECSGYRLRTSTTTLVAAISNSKSDASHAVQGPTTAEISRSDSCASGSPRTQDARHSFRGTNSIYLPFLSGMRETTAACGVLAALWCREGRACSGSASVLRSTLTQRKTPSGHRHASRQRRRQSIRH